MLSEKRVNKNSFLLLKRLVKMTQNISGLKHIKEKNAHLSHLVIYRICLSDNPINNRNTYIKMGAKFVIHVEIQMNFYVLCVHILWHKSSSTPTFYSCSNIAYLWLHVIDIVTLYFVFTKLHPFFWSEQYYFNCYWLGQNILSFY